MKKQKETGRNMKKQRETMIPDLCFRAAWAPHRLSSDPGKAVAGPAHRTAKLIVAEGSSVAAASPKRQELKAGPFSQLLHFPGHTVIATGRPPCDRKEGLKPFDFFQPKHRSTAGRGGGIGEGEAAAAQGAQCQRRPGAAERKPTLSTPPLWP